MARAPDQPLNPQPLLPLGAASSSSRRRRPCRDHLGAGNPQPLHQWDPIWLRPQPAQAWVTTASSGLHLSPLFTGNHTPLNYMPFFGYGPTSTAVLNTNPSLHGYLQPVGARQNDSLIHGGLGSWGLGFPYPYLAGDYASGAQWPWDGLNRQTVASDSYLQQDLSHLVPRSIWPPSEESLPTTEGYFGGDRSASNLMDGHIDLPYRTSESNGTGPPSSTPTVFTDDSGIGGLSEPLDPVASSDTSRQQIPLGDASKSLQVPCSLVQAPQKASIREAGVSRDAMRNNDSVQRKKRKRTQTEEGRTKTKEMRTTHACIRCRILHKPVRDYLIAVPFCTSCVLLRD